MSPRVPPAEASAPDWLRRLWQAPWLWMALVVLLCCVPLFRGLGDIDMENDEAIYSYGVETMLEQGDWLTPKAIPSDTTPLLEKPPLKLWITALPLRLGVLPGNEFGLRFMDALMGSLAFLYVFAIGRRLAGPVCGLASALLLFTHGHLLFTHGLRTNNMEAAVVLAYCGGLYHFLAWRSPNPDVKRHIVGMALYFVLGFMTKFVAVLFLPVIVGSAALLTRPDRARLYRDWQTFAWTSVLAVALIAPWFVYQYQLRPQELVNTMFGQHVYQRLTGALDPAHLQPWSFYFTQIWAELRTAGTLLLTSAGALLMLAHTVRRRWVEGAVVLLWFVVPIGVISMGTSKLYHYAYPFLPPLALAGGYAVALGANWLHGWLARPAAAAGRRLRAPMAVLRALVVATVLLAAMPLTTYRGHVGRTGDARHTVRDLRDCLRPIVRITMASGQPSPGVWIEAPAALPHVFTYYLRGLGPWHHRDVGPGGRHAGSDGTVIKHLLAADNYRPVLLSRQRYEEVRARVVEQPAALFAWVSRLTLIDPAVLELDARDALLGIITFPEYGGHVLLLPGPYAGCAPARTRLGTPQQP